MVFQPALMRSIVGTVCGDDRPETRAVIQFAPVGQFMDDDVIEDVGRSQDESPAEVEPTERGATAPPRATVADCQARVGDPEDRGELLHTLGNDPARFTA